MKENVCRCGSAWKTVMRDLLATSTTTGSIIKVFMRSKAQNKQTENAKHHSAN